MNILAWHVHGSWMTAFVQGSHRYLLPLDAERSEWGRGRARTWTWPDSAVEVSPEEIDSEQVDVVVLQRPEELELVSRWLGMRGLGREVPIVYVEHNAPQGRIAEMRHPTADWELAVVVVHVTHFNDLFWDCGHQSTRVIEHGIVDPGLRFTGRLPRLAAVINEPVRRGRVTGTDVLTHLAEEIPIDLYGMATEPLGGTEHLPQAQLHRRLADHRAYLHPVRWTSLGLSLIEAMQLGMPVLALATTEVREAVPAGAGVVSTNVKKLEAGARWLLEDPDAATAMGRVARTVALERFGLERFLADWDGLLREVAG